MAELPPWLTRDYDPVGTFMRAYQTGAQIRQEQTRLAEQQRQANMEAQARQQQLEQQALLAAVNAAVEKSYNDQRISMEQARLENERKRNEALATKAADDLAERINHNIAMENERIRANDITLQKYFEGQTSKKAFSDEYQRLIDSGKSPSEAYRGALMKSPGLITPGTVTGLKGTESKGLQATLTPGDEEMTLRGTPQEIEAYRAAQKAKKEAEGGGKGAAAKAIDFMINPGLPGTIPNLVRLLSGQPQPLPNLPAPRVVGPGMEKPLKPIDRKTAEELFERAGRDPVKARQMAKELGYSF